MRFFICMSFVKLQRVELSWPLYKSFKTLLSFVTSLSFFYIDCV